MGGLAWILVRRNFGSITFSGYHRPRGVLNAAFFAFNISAENVNSGLDKALLVRLDTLAVAGIYGAAYRAVEITLVPLWALLMPAEVVMFKAGAASRYAVQLELRAHLNVATPYAIFAGIALYFCAPLLPVLLSSQYKSSVPVVQLLAVFPLLYSTRAALGIALAGFGEQRYRAIANAIGVLTLLANLVLIPLYSWEGADYATLGVEFVLTLALGARFIRKLSSAESATGAGI